MKLLTLLILVFFEFLPQSGFGHGMDKPGPHGGSIKMPASFHTEIVRVKANQFKVYLLDIEFKNPSTAKSGVEFWFKQGTKEIEFKCEAKQNEYFQCETSAKVPAKGKITLKTYREGIVGNDVVYDLPLSTKKKKR